MKAVGQFHVVMLQLALHVCKADDLIRRPFEEEQMMITKKDYAQNFSGKLGIYLWDTAYGFDG